LLTLFLAGTIAPPARADIYTWVDAAGNMNLSNLAPPASAHVINVVHASPQPVAAREAVRQAEVQALEDRVRQLDRKPSSRVSGSAAAIPAGPCGAGSSVCGHLGAGASSYAAAAPPSPGYCDATQLECGLWGFRVSTPRAS